jgi:hypothetical protein
MDPEPHRSSPVHLLRHFSLLSHRSLCALQAAAPHLASHVSPAT